MSITDTQTVDLIGIDKSSGDCVLTITDHLDWDDGEHLINLQDKINTYLAFIESDELMEQYPNAKGRRIRIDVVVLHEPDEAGLRFFGSAGAIIEDAGFSLCWTRHCD